VLILEGPDGSGKTLLAQRIRRTKGLEVLHAGGPPDSCEEAMRRHKLQVSSFGKLLDRCMCISEMVYGTALRGAPVIPADKLWTLFDEFVKANFILVYCRPEDKTLFDYADKDMARVIRETGKAYKTEQHAQAVRDNYQRILYMYDITIRHIERNTDMVVLRYVRPELNI